jgi:hypothetical protein
MVECVFDHVRNWLVCALQTEEDTGSEYALSLRLADCEDLVFTNLFTIRICQSIFATPMPATWKRCREIRFRWVHIFTGRDAIRRYGSRRRSQSDRRKRSGLCVLPSDVQNR